MSDWLRGVALGIRPKVVHLVAPAAVESDLSRRPRPGWWGLARCGTVAYSLERHESMWSRPVATDGLRLCGHCAKFVAESPGQTDYPTGRINP